MSPDDNPPTEADDLIKKAQVEEAAATARSARASARRDEIETDLAEKNAKLASEKQAAETRQAIAEAEKAEREARWPQGETKPLEGKTEIDDKAGYPAQVVAQQVMRRCAKEVGQRVNKLDESAKILIVDSLNFAHGDYALIQVRTQFKTFRELINSFETKLRAHLQPPAKQPESKLVREGIEAAKSLVSGTADILGYLRTDYSVKGIEFTLNDEALRASVAGMISRPTYIFNFNLVKASALVQEFSDLLTRRVALEGLKERVRQEIIEPEANATEDEQKAAVAKAQADVTEWQTFAAAFDKYMLNVASSSQGSSESTLVLAATREYIESAKITHLLYVKAISAGGDVTTQRSLWPPSNNKITYLAGGAISFVLSQADGQVVAADTLTELSWIKYHLAWSKVQRSGSLDLSSLSLQKSSWKTD